MLRIIGKTTINPILFYSGKISGYIIWAILILSLITTRNPIKPSPEAVIAGIFICIGFVFVIISLINLGRSTRLGIPVENTEFKTSGLYKISRNPMYLGFNMLSLSAMLFVHSWIVIALGLYSIFIYHIIILAEEKYLENRFMGKYLEYKKVVRRYF